MKGQKIFSSWSGGKDSCLALYNAVKAGGKAAGLLTMMIEDGSRSRSHGLRPEIIRAQADNLGLPLLMRQTSWDEYETTFLSALEEIKGQGIENGIFGDIDLQPHRDWVERVCGGRGITPHLPLWQRARRELLSEFIEAGFAAMIVAVRDERLDASFLGRTLNWQTIDDLEKAGADACGEEGEFHTVVTGGPLFSRPVRLREKGILHHSGCSFLDLELDV